MDSAASPMDSSLSIQECWARPFIPTYRAILREGKRFHDAYLHGLFVAYYDRFSCSLGEPANPEDIESVYTWKKQALEVNFFHIHYLLHHSNLSIPRVLLVSCYVSTTSKWILQNFMRSNILLWILQRQSRIPHWLDP